MKNIFLFFALFSIYLKLYPNAVIIKNDSIFSSITFQNYDKKLYKISDFKDKYVFVTSCSVNIREFKKILDFFLTYYENILENKKDYVFIITIYNQNKDEKKETESLENYKEFCKNIKIKSDRLFLTYESFNNRKITFSKILDTRDTPAYHFFYIDEKGKECLCGFDKKPCYTDIIEHNFKNLNDFIMALFNNKKLHKLWYIKK